MDDGRPSSVALALAAGRKIDLADVIALLAEVYPGGIGARADAEALIAFDRSLTDGASAWRDFFADTVAGHVLRWREPKDVVDGEKADWLARQLAPKGRIATAAGLEAAVRTMESARAVPASLAAFALGQLCQSIVSREGPAIGRRRDGSRAIDASELALIRRILRAGAGAVTRLEAECLFDLHDATAGADNDPGFEDLFFKAIANHLAAAAGHKTASRERALAADERTEPARLGPDEAAWLASRIMRDGRPTAVEHALLRLFGECTAETDGHIVTNAA